MQAYTYVVQVALYSVGTYDDDMSPGVCHGDRLANTPGVCAAEQ